MQVERHQGIAGALNLADQLADLGGMQQQLARAYRIGTDVGRSRRQGTDMATDQKNLSVTQNYIGLLQLNPACTDRLDVPTFENDAGLDALLDEVIVKGLLMVYNAHCGFALEIT